MKKKDIKVPNRDPDFELYTFQFWWKEKIQINTSLSGKIFILKYSDDMIYFTKPGSKDWVCFLGNEIIFAYKKWIISNCLKEKIK